MRRLRETIWRATKTKTKLKRFDFFQQNTGREAGILRLPGYLDERGYRVHSRVRSNEHGNGIVTVVIVILRTGILFLKILSRARGNDGGRSSFLKNAPLRVYIYTTCNTRVYIRTWCVRINITREEVIQK